MANETTTTTLDDLIPSIITEAMFTAEEKSLMAGLVRNYSLPFGSGKTIDVPIYGRPTAAAVAEGTDLSNTAISTSKATLTVGEVGIMTTVTDFARNASSQNVISDVGQLFGEAIAKAQDVALLGLFDGFSTIVGGATTTITVPHIFEAVTRLRSQGLDPSGMACVLHPYVAYDLKSALTNTFVGQASDTSNEAMRSGFIGFLAGIPVYESANISDTTGDSLGGLFHRDALGLATMQGIVIEPQRDASLRATELVATAVYGAGELNDTYGIEMSFDSTLEDA